MALIKFGGGVAAISGTIAGTVYARNRAGAYSRNWAKPINAPTIPQSQRRVLFGQTASMWSELSLAARDGWNALAATTERKNRLGDTYQPTGRQIFMEVQQNMLLAGETPFAAAPADTNKPGMIASANVTFFTAAGNLDEAAAQLSPAPTAGSVLIVFATPPVPNTGQRTNYNSLYRRVGDSFAIVGNTADFTTGYTDLYGDAMANGEAINWKLAVLDPANGQVSDYLLGQSVSRTED